MTTAVECVTSLRAMKTCFLFPGQGAQHPGMARDLWESSQKVKDLFHLASGQTGMDLEALLFEAGEEELKATDKTQVAMTLASLSASTVLKEKGIQPEGAAGFSLGEYAALHEAGVLNVSDLFLIVKQRGRLMEQASRNLDSPDGSPGMAAVIGLTYEDIAPYLGEIDGIYAANHNSPTQIVVSGTSEGLDKAEEAFKKAGARRYIRLRVSGPFHSPLLEEARQGLEDFLGSFTFSDPVLPVYANVTGRRIASGEEAKSLCVQQIISTVRWVDEEKSLMDDGFDRFLEVGPGTVLTGLWKRIESDHPCLPAGELDSIGKLHKE